GVAPVDVDYLEAHGTGTRVGDPIEVEAAMAVFGGRARPLLLGSVKTNLGHLEAAAGAAAVAKVALALEHGEIPAHLHLKTLNPLLRPWASSFTIPSRTTPWPQPSAGSRFACVNAMGMSGTNVHVVLEESHGRSYDGLSSRDPVEGLEDAKPRLERQHLV